MVMKQLIVTVFAGLSFGVMASAQDGPLQYPRDGANNTVLPVMERPEGGWPENVGGDMFETCAPELPAQLRVSKITGDRADFDEAQKMHQAWYQKYGYGSVIMDFPVMLPDLENETSVRQDEISVSLTVYDGEAYATAEVTPGELRRDNDEADAEWDAFVTKYQENSEIIEAMRTCAPASMLKRKD
ncbi:MAG: hypothetical protein F6K17_41810 [Okeania sp. SIO3C4]|nr:hypothetical protein [Okeania sp. SIO3C4]